MQELVKALIKARKNFKTVTFDKSGARNKYATLKSILLAVDEALMNEGILFVQSELVGKDFPQPLLETKLIHISGQSISSLAPIASDQKSPIGNENQRYGAALSYARRYSAMTILGLYADDADLDDYDHQKKEGYIVNQETERSITGKQLELLQRILGKKEEKALLIARIYSRYGVSTLEDLSSKQASDIISALNGAN